MFVIPCKFNPEFPFVVELVDGIRKYHPTEEIVVVDSASEDKSYFKILEGYDVIIEDINNIHWMVGAYWHVFKKYKRDYYYFLHDSMKVKGSMGEYKKNDLTILAYFNRMVGHPRFNCFEKRINDETGYIYNTSGHGCMGPVFFCKYDVMKKLQDKGADKILPINKKEVWCCEGCYGFYFEAEGYDLEKCSLWGDFLELQSTRGRSGPYPHNTTWQYPVEKFQGSNTDLTRTRGAYDKGEIYYGTN